MLRKLATALGALALAIGLAAPASAEAFDASTVTCGDVLKTFAGKASSKAEEDKKTSTGLLLFWLAGYQVHEDQGRVVDFKRLEGDIEKIGSMCEKSPALGLMTISEKVWKQKPPMTAESVDLTTVTCQAAIGDTEKAAAMLLWLMGYNAGSEQDPMFDLEGVTKTLSEVGEFCAKNPKVGLATALDKVSAE